MRLTIIQTGEVPEPLRAEFGRYAPMFEKMFEHAGEDFAFEIVPVSEGAPLPDPRGLEAILLPGSAAGVYEDHHWLPPLRAFIRDAYTAETPMVGICFGHQVMADALGGVVRQSEKGWGLGRHTYAAMAQPALLGAEGFAIACSHQDQVIVPPAEAEVILGSEFTPNAGLAYRNGRALSLQPHPEFEDGYAVALAELRRGRAPDAVVDDAVNSMATPSDSLAMARLIGRFLRAA